MTLLHIQRCIKHRCNLGKAALNGQRKDSAAIAEMVEKYSEGNVSEETLLNYAGKMTRHSPDIRIYD
jgi:hypothetical protein